MCMGTEFPQATAAHYFSLVSPCILLTLCLSTLQIKREQTINDQKEVLLNLPAPLRSQIFQGMASLYTSFFPADRSRNCCCYHQTANSTLIIITLVDVNGPSLCYLIYKSDLHSVPVAQAIRYIFINIPVNNKTHTTETGNTSWIYCTYQTLHRGKNQEKSDTHYTADFVKNNNCFVCLIKSLHHAFPIVKLIKGFCPRKEAAFTECLQFTKQPKAVFQNNFGSPRLDWTGLLPETTHRLCYGVHKDLYFIGVTCRCLQHSSYHQAQPVPTPIGELKKNSSEDLFTFML